MRVKISRVHTTAGDRLYEARLGEVVLATIRHVAKLEAQSPGCSVPDPHWALARRSGRIDRLESFSAARDEAWKL